MTEKGAVVAYLGNTITWDQLIKEVDISSLGFCRSSVEAKRMRESYREKVEEPNDR